jgi:hypothetical protein
VFLGTRIFKKKKKDTEQSEKDYTECCDRGKKAYGQALKHFTNDHVGSHYLKLNTCEDLAKAINLKKGEVCWDVGCGKPVLAAFLSAYTLTSTSCTEINHNGVYDWISTCCEGILKSLSTSSDAANKVIDVLFGKLSTKLYEKYASIISENRENDAWRLLYEEISNDDSSTTSPISSLKSQIIHQISKQSKTIKYICWGR